MALDLKHRQSLSEKMMTAEEEKEVIAAWQDQGDRKALDRLVRSHARLAFAIAARYAKNPAHVEDLASAGMQGLLRAADRFDRNAGTRFSTYAKWWVKTFVSNEVSQVSLVVDVPSRTFIDAKMGRLEGEKADKAHMAVYGGVDLNAPLGDEGDLSAMDRLECPRPSPEMSVNKRRREDTFAKAIEQAIEVLGNREREIVYRRRLKDPPDTLECIADDLQVTRERVRQIEVKAMGKLKRGLVARGFAVSMLRE